MKKISIDRHIPMPPTKYNYWTRTMRKMEEGDSFHYVTKNNEQSLKLRCSIYRAAKNMNVTVITRRTKTGFRVWMKNKYERERVPNQCYNY